MSRRVYISIKKVSDNRLETATKRLKKLVKLDKPLVIFSLETTGMSISTDKIVEIAYVKIWKDGRIKKDNLLLNPEINISKELTEIHGIKDEDTKNKSTFKEKAQELWDIFNDSNYGGFKIINFSLPVLKREFIRVGMDFNYSTSYIIDSRIVYGHMEPRTLASTYKHYCNKEYDQTVHNGLTDVETITEILKSQLKKYREARDWDFILRINQTQEIRHEDKRKKFYWRNGEAFFAFSYVECLFGDLNPRKS